MLTTYAIRINSNGHDFHFHTTEVSKLRELFAHTLRNGAMGDFTIWADQKELDRMEQARLAFGTLPYTN